MNKQILALVLLFALAFVAAFILMGGLDELGPSNDPGPIQNPAPAPSDLASAPPAVKPPAAQGIAQQDTVKNAASPEVEGEKPGSILATVLDSEGEPLREFAVDLRPFSGRVRSNEHGLLEIKGVAQGRYVLAVWAQGHLRQDRPNVDVMPGKETRLSFKLNRGIRPQGMVFDSITRAPVSGALVEFHGGGHCRSQSDGHFEAAYDLAPTCLSRITVSHPGYDRFTYNQLAIQDVHDVKLALTRGTSVLRGRITNSSGRVLPAQYRIRLWLERGGNLPPEVRRERLFKPSESFKLTGIHRGIYHIMLGFPGTNMADRQRDIEFLYGEQKNLDLQLEAGILLRGRLVTRGRLRRGTKIELINSTGLTACTVFSDQQGRFRMDGIEAGTWRLRVWQGMPVQDFPAFQVGQSSLSAELDLEKHRIKLGVLRQK